MPGRASLLTEQQARTLRALCGRSRTRTNLADELGIKLGALDYRLRELESHGYVSHDPKRRYALTRAGADALARHTRRVRAKYGWAA